MPTADWIEKVTESESIKSLGGDRMITHTDLEVSNRTKGIAVKSETAGDAPCDE